MIKTLQKAFKMLLRYISAKHQPSSSTLPKSLRKFGMTKGEVPSWMLKGNEDKIPKGLAIDYDWSCIISSSQNRPQ